jgi:hypothetical protein
MATTPREGQYRRAVRDVQQSGLWPSCPLIINHLATRRHEAIAVVLRRLPEDAYQCLQKFASTFIWYIPDVTAYGEVRGFSVTYEKPNKDGSTRHEARVLCLSPILERASLRVAVAVVAHELAHIALNHDPFQAFGDNPAQESEALQKTLTWGFEREVRSHRISLARRTRPRSR